ncbi:MAG TPA: hypothetical protein DEB32_16620 [Stenotrophomonas sp.]|uniref:hypothetical protein n=1 Tax=Stenotrophomonas sp. TaxID=69392 RepID=UPI000E8E8F2D|nr:hypothetical protein [Stenotrophomonas sp.]HBS64294.1 hypothetical protein [Stenotrophomonas sp.]
MNNRDAPADRPRKLPVLELAGCHVTTTSFTCHRTTGSDTMPIVAHAGALRISEVSAPMLCPSCCAAACAAEGVGLSQELFSFQ